MSVTPANVPSESDRHEIRRRELRDELRALVCSFNPALAQDLADDTSLIASGVIDSQALFTLVVWIESKSAHPIDPTAIEIARQFDTITAILQYLAPSGAAENAARPAVVGSARRPSRYRIVRYVPRFSRAVAEFQKGLWSPDAERNLNYLEWKYQSNPYANESRLYLAFDDDELVGTRGFYGSRWEVGLPVQRVPLLVADDLLLSEQHRNQGLVREIMSVAREDLQALGEQYVINLSGGSLTVLESLAMGWRIAGMLDPLLRKSPTGRVIPTLRRMLARLGVPNANRWQPAGPIRSFARLDRAPNPSYSEGGLDIEIDDHPRIPEMLDLIQRLGYDGRCRHVRDESFLRWRYRNPFREYRFLYSTDVALNGFLVFTRAIDEISAQDRVSIVDLEGVTERVKSALLDVAVRVAAFDELVMWAAPASDETRQQLRRFGFRSVAKVTAFETPSILVWPVDDAARDGQGLVNGVDLMAGSNWDMRMIYSMAG